MNNFCKILIIILASCCQLRANGFEGLLDGMMEMQSFEVKYDNYSDYHNLNIGIGLQEYIFESRRLPYAGNNDLSHSISGLETQGKILFLYWNINSAQTNQISSFGIKFIESNARSINRRYNFNLGIDLLSMDEDINTRQFDILGFKIGTSLFFLSELQRNLNISLDINCAYKDLTPKFDFFREIRTNMKSKTGFEIFPEFQCNFTNYPFGLDFIFNHGLFYSGKNNGNIVISKASVKLFYDDIFYLQHIGPLESGFSGYKDYDLGFQIDYLAMNFKDIAEESLSFSIVFRYFYNKKPFVVE